MGLRTTGRALLPAVLLLGSFSTLATSSARAEPEPTQSVPLVSQDTQVARGLIVKTTTSAPSNGVLESTGEALGSGTEVTDSTKIASRINSVGFSDIVDVDQAREVAAELEKRSDVVWAVPDTLNRIAAASPVSLNDAYFGSQKNLWDARSDDSYGLLPVGGYSTKATALWRASRGSATVVVAVLDTGITGHPDLISRTVKGYDMIDAYPYTPGGPASTFFSNDLDGRDPDPADPGDWTADDDCGTGVAGRPSTWHGTEMAGIIAASGNNKIGITGIAPIVKVQPIRVLGTCGGWDSDILAGITWASGGTVAGVPANATPAKVVNLSLASYYATTPEATTARTQMCQAYSSVVAQARARGSLVVAAAGNNNGDVSRTTPASCDGVLAVASTGASGGRAGYSNTGALVDIAAPGGDVSVDGEGILTLSNTGTSFLGSATYAQTQGTSAAAATVSAAAGLIYSLGNFSPDQVETALKTSVSPFRLLPGSFACTTALCGVGALDLSKVPGAQIKPSISGSTAIGQKLTGVRGIWVGSPTSYAYQWMRDGVAIAGATGTTYTLPSSEFGRSITFKVTASKSGYPPIAYTSVPAKVTNPTATSVGWSIKKAKYGVSRTASIAVKAQVGQAGGVVEIREGSRVLARATLMNGSAKVKLPGTALAAGSHAVRVYYVGPSASPSASTATTLSVTKTTSKISLTVPKSVKKSKRATVSVKVKVVGVPSPKGKVKIYDGKKLIATISLTSLGKGSVLLPKLSKTGSHKIKAVYVGTSSITGKSSSTKRLTVKK
ncbi:hypothetical protein BH09ACT10_BH09ACT10_21200 [soil metagenome]